MQDLPTGVADATIDLWASAYRAGRTCGVPRSTLSYWVANGSVAARRQNGRLLLFVPDVWRVREERSRRELGDVSRAS